MKKTPKNLNQVAIKISQLLKDTSYAIRGTASLVLQGYDMNADDIDILCDKKTALMTNEIFSEYLVEEVSYKESDKYKSYFGKFEIDKVSVEVYGDWEIKDTKGKWTDKYNASNRNEVILDDNKIYVTPVSLELEFFIKMGRWAAFQKLKKQIPPQVTPTDPGGTTFSKAEPTSTKLLIIDTFNFLHRAYHALPKTFRDQNGEATNAVYGVTSMLINVIDQIKPTHIIAAVDSEKPTFRVEDFTAYKAHRKPMEEDLSSQIPKVMEILDAFEIKRFLVEGYEADDIIGTMVKRFKDTATILIVSNDRDLWQLADKQTMIMLPSQKGEFEWIGRDEAKARLGFDPEKVPDYKGLRGDPSDNIPGVFGIGEKTATKLIQDYGSIEEVFKNIKEITPESLRERLLNSYEQALMCKKLAQLILDVPVQANLDSCVYHSYNKVKVKKVLEKYNFKSLIKRLGFETTDSKGENPKDNSSQLSLF